MPTPSPVSAAPDVVPTARDLEWLRTMLLIRGFEERINSLFAEGRLGGTTHPAVGQEAVAVGACAALGPLDYVVSTHRGHGHLLARGADPGRMFAELMGRSTGYCGGRGGSQHICIAELGFLGTNGITGGGLPMATGAALSLKLRGVPGVSLSFFGDGATNQGTFHESLNMASLWKLPVIYLCENNFYAMSVPLAQATSVQDLSLRGAAYGMRARRVDGMDPEAVYEAVREATTVARAGGGPTLLEALTYRHLGHSKSDKRVYRTREEEEHWLVKDPVRRWRERLLANGAPERELQRVEQEVERDITRAVAFAESSSEPDPATARLGVYA
ncbi:MAG: thiamine pyrophosphate-dependent dehydrogenase E1 component subunit alpha [Gemmatimonadota bacterium]